MRALVIDASSAMRLIVAGILRDAGMEVVEASSEREALEKIAAQGPIDLGLVDCNLSSYGFLKALRGKRGADELRLIAVSTEGTQEAQARAAGASDFVIKPFTAEALRKKVLRLAPALP